LQELLRVCESSSAVSDTGPTSAAADAMSDIGSGDGGGGIGLGRMRARGTLFIRTMVKKLQQLLLKHLE
jgi:hypothetical protein